MSAEDPLIELENLESPRTRSIINRFNNEVNELLANIIDKHYSRIRELHDEPRVAGAVLIREGIAVLYRGSTEEVYLLHRDGTREKLLSSHDKEVFTWISKVHGSERLVAVSASLEGRDYSRTYIVDVNDGEIVYMLDGIVDSFHKVGDSLIYVRNYRTEKPPDGGDIPTERLVMLQDGREEVVWGSGIVGAGELMERVFASGDFSRLAVTVQRGWRSARLYVIEYGSWSSSLVEEADHPILLAGWFEGPVYVRAKDTGDELVVQGEELGIRGILESALVSGDKLLVVTMTDAVHNVNLYDLRVKSWSSPSMPVRYASISIQDEHNGEFLLLASTPSHRHLLFTVRDGEALTWDASVAIPDLEVKDLWLRSSDGVKVHAFYISRTSPPRAVLIYAYGGFGISLTPSYNPFFHYLLERDYAIVIVNARGGREEGEAWHRAGMLENKENTFKDVASFARFFKALGFRVAAMGSSNGGLTVAALATRWPEYLDAALIGYPVLDMLRYHLLYVGRYWIPEYGDPEDPKMREILLRYSPYHNIPSEKRMPPTLIFTGLNDDRVHPAHALKFAEKARGSGHPVYLRVETTSGHMGAKSAVRALEQSYLAAFLEKYLEGR
ncbi:prolyl oligopeptidase family serine peptidase [Infirmifilum uzonense]|uniref:prolyl oligopeptidase family serine peptidase n=1 Tax=Infirmifilum uzonense TaxID=1550241 RepID=UPI003C761CE5